MFEQFIWMSMYIITWSQITIISRVNACYLGIGYQRVIFFVVSMKILENLGKIRFPGKQRNRCPLVKIHCFVKSAAIIILAFTKIAMAKHWFCLKMYLYVYLVSLNVKHSPFQNLKVIPKFHKEFESTNLC